jgi:hypothetical protein
MDDSAPFALGCLLGLMVPFLYLLAVLSYCSQADLAATRSCFPARMFTLPVPTAFLVGWPMLFGSIMLIAAWIAIALCILLPSGIRAPLVWPACLAATLLAWLQALLWRPSRLPYMRLGLIPIALLTHAAAAIGGIAEQVVSPAQLVSLLGASSFAAYGLAWHGVMRARVGETPTWPWPRNWLMSFPSGSGERRRFESPLEAQTWFERRRHRIATCAWNGILLFYLAAPLWFALSVLLPTREITLPTALASELAMIPLFACLVGPSLGAIDPWDKSRISAFFATRPVSCSTLVGIKFQAALWLALSFWCLALVVIPLVVNAAGRTAEVLQWGQQLWQACPPEKAATIVALSTLTLVVLTWSQIAGGLWIGLTGRKWVVSVSILVGLPLFYGSLGLAYAILKYPQAQRTFWGLCPWIAGAAALSKMMVMVWICRALRRRDLVSPRALRRFLGLWWADVGALIAVLMWLVPPGNVSFSVLTSAVILFVPFNRLGLAPLALAWNRHR